MVNSKVILVDESDREKGEMEKLEAHRKGLLHRAYSVFVFNNKGEVLLQKRSEKKYHSAGLWTNACCSHPQPGEDTIQSAKERLYMEMGIKGNLDFHSKFIYKSEFENGLTEYEVDHLFVCHSDVVPKVDPGEVAEWRYVSPRELCDEIMYSPEKFTTWFRIIVERQGIIS